MTGAAIDMNESRSIVARQCFKSYQILKLCLVALGFFFLFGLFIMGNKSLFELMRDLTGMALLFLSGNLGLWAWKKPWWRFVSHLIFIFDLVLIFLIICFAGGGILLNTWVTQIAVFILFAGYIFGFAGGLLYALFASISLVGIFFLEFFHIIPYIDTYNTADFYFTNTKWEVDALLGYVLLFIFAAIISNWFSSNLQRITQKNEEALLGSKKTQEKLQHAMAELSQAEGSLEAKVTQRADEIMVKNKELETEKEKLEEMIEKRMRELSEKASIAERFYQVTGGREKLFQERVAELNAINARLGLPPENIS